MNIWKLAWRNLLRAKRRSAVTLAAMVLALTTMIAYSGLVEGHMNKMQRSVVDLELGELQIHADSYRKKPSIYKRVPSEPALLSALEDAGYRVAPRLLASGLVAAGDMSAGVRLRGVDPKRDPKVSHLAQHLHEGEWLDPQQSNGVVVGKRLARILGVSTGDEIVFLGQAADGSIANELYRVAGILSSIAADVDRGGIYMLESTFRDTFGLDAGYHQLILRKPQDRELEASKTQVTAIVAPFSEKSPLEVKSWRELMVTLATMIDSSRSSMMIMFGIVYLAIGLVILNAMLMTVFERVREFGVLKAIGVGPWQVVALVYAECALQILIATGLSLVVSMPLMLFLQRRGIDLSGFGDLSLAGVHFDPIWRAEISAQVFVIPWVTMLVIVMVAVLYPALKAAWINPIQAMRHR